MSAAAFFDDVLIRAKKGMGHTRISSAPKTRGERMWNSLSSTGSAFIKRIPGAGVQHGKQLAGQLAYVNGKAKGTFGFASGVATGAEAFEQAELDQLIDAWSQDWKGRPRNGHTSHMVLSFPDDVSQDAAFAIAREWCAEMFENGTHIDDKWEYIAALHTDTPNPHVHVILNNRGQDGQWFSISSEGVFNPQMMRDRMTDLADTYGVRLESLTRADRGLYSKPISSEEVFAAREGRALGAKTTPEGSPVDWRVQDILHTAELYTTLAEFAEVIGAPMFANRAHLSAAALFAGKEVPKGSLMSLDLDVTADREDIRVTLVEWVEQNREKIDALPEAQQHEIMEKIDRALDIVESDVTYDLTEETVWGGFGRAPSAYLIHDADAIEARAARYVAEDHVETLSAFVAENALDRYLVTGSVEDKYKPALKAVAEAYAEIRGHDLADIPKEMKEYVRQAGYAGLDAADFQERLINPVADPVENMKMERQDIATIAKNRTWAAQDDLAAQAAMKTLLSISKDSFSFENNDIGDNEVFRNLAESVKRGGLLDKYDPDYTPPLYDMDEISDKYFNDRMLEVSEALIDLAHKDGAGALSPEQSELFKPLAAEIFQTHGAAINAAIYEVAEIPELRAGVFEQAMSDYGPSAAQANINAHRYAEQAYADLQDGLAEVERSIVDKGKFYSRDGVASVLQKAAHTAATTGRADFADSEASRMVLKAFVALEGKDAMAELATGNMDPLAEYLDTPASRRLAARELLRSAKQVDVGLGLDQIEDGLEAVDPNYSRSRGISI